MEKTKRLADTLQRRVVGQDEAIHELVCSFSRVFSGLRDSSRPVLNVLMLGPTGVGKTETAKAIAETLFGTDRGLLRINCEEYSHGHEVAKLLGSPPGYIGHSIEPLLSQRRIDEAHKRASRESRGMIGDGDESLNRFFPGYGGPHLSVILFDEIEKASPSVWSALLGILEDGELTLGDNTTSDFTGSLILATSNVGSREMGEVLEGQRVGFVAENHVARSRDLSASALQAARESFPLEFLNRFDESLVYSALEDHHLDAILDKYLAEIHERALGEAGHPMLLRVGPRARAFIIEQGTDVRFGARPLRRAVEKLLIDPLSRLIAAETIHPGEIIEVVLEGEELAFYRSTDMQAVMA